MRVPSETSSVDGDPAVIVVVVVVVDGDDGDVSDFEAGGALEVNAVAVGAAP